MFGFDDPFGTKIKNTGRDTRRSFTAAQKKEILYQQNGKCAICQEKLDPRDIEYDHKKAWADRGRTIVVNGRAVCGSCHNIITHKQRLNKTEKTPKNPAKKATNPFDFTIPAYKPPKMPKGKGGFGLF